jgi:hypothetical protein
MDAQARLWQSEEAQCPSHFPSLQVLMLLTRRACSRGQYSEVTLQILRPCLARARLNTGHLLLEAELLLRLMPSAG